MDKQIIVLSGMPASGKDTVTEKLCKEHAEFLAIKKYRSVGEKDPIKDTYINVSKEEFGRKIHEGCFLQFHMRYGRYYGIAKETLCDCFEKDLIPVIHIGRIENYYVFKKAVSEFENEQGYSVNLHHALLWETKDVLFERISERDKTADEIEKRKNAMDQEFLDNIEMMNRKEKPYTVVIKNQDLHETTEQIFLLTKEEPIDSGYEEFWRYLKTL